MAKELTNSPVVRQNILNNSFALQQLESDMQLGGRFFENELVFTKLQVAEILDIEVRTVERYIESYEEELAKNGYRILRGKALKTFKLSYVSDIYVGDINPKVPTLSVFTFRALLNLAMLVTESERAKLIRGKILDVALRTIENKSGGDTKFINQRDINYLPTALAGENYRKNFTDSLGAYVDLGRVKYPIYTNKIYQIVFRENAIEYKKILSLSAATKIRDTMYCEVLTAIASIENGLAAEIKERSEKLGRKLKQQELDEIFDRLKDNPYLKPSIEHARTCMASRDLGFRDTLHEKLESYIQSISKDDYDRFLGEKSISLQEKLSISEIIDVLKRLKDK